MSLFLQQIVEHAIISRCINNYIYTILEWRERMKEKYHQAVYFLYIMFVFFLVLFGKKIVRAIEMQQTQLEEYYKNQQVIVEFNSSSILFKELQKGLEKEVILPNSKISVLAELISDTSAIITIEKKEQIPEVLKELKDNEEILYMQPNYSYYLLEESREFIKKNSSSNWWLENDGSYQSDSFTSCPDIDIDAIQAWEHFSNSDNSKRDKREVIIAVVDTGIDYTHKALKKVMWKNPYEIQDDMIDNDKNGYKDDIYGWNFYSDNNNVMEGEEENDHGTHIAGIIAAQKNSEDVIGVASNIDIKIMSIKVLGTKDGIGTTYSVAKGILYAQQMGAEICNLSFGTTYNDRFLQETIKDSPMLFVVAAGNGDGNKKGIDIDKTMLYPASYSFDNIITVANCQMDGTLHISSNYGKVQVDIAAPGLLIYSTITGDHYDYMSGTSMSAPMVSGIAAMAFAYYKNVNAKQVRTIILESAKPVKELSNQVNTGGIVSAYRVLTNPDYQYLIKEDAKSTQTTIVLNKNKKLLKVGSSFQLIAALIPEKEDTEIFFVSNNKKVVSVGKRSGYIYAKKKGRAIITAKTKSGLIATCQVTVK